MILIRTQGPNISFRTIMYITKDLRAHVARSSHNLFYKTTSGWLWQVLNLQ